MKKPKVQLSETPINEAALQYINNPFTINGITYATIPSIFTKDKVANPRTKEDTNTPNVYVKQGTDGKWYQTRMDKDANNINYYLDNKALIDRSNEIIDNQWEQGDGHKIAVNQADARARQQWFSNEDATKFLLTTAGLGALGGGLISAPLATTLGLAGSYVGGKAVDKGMQLGTGKTWAQWMNDKTGLPEWFSEFTNPGTIAGGGIGGRKGFKWDKSVQNNLNYSLARRKWYAPIEYAIAHNPIGRRGIQMAMNTTDFSDPKMMLDLYFARLPRELAQKEVRKRAAAQLNYLLFGKVPKKIPSTYKNLPTEGRTGYYDSFDYHGQGATGLRGNTPERLRGEQIFKSPKRQLLFNTGLDERYFTKVNDGDYSTWEPYLLDHPEYRNDIYITNQVGPTKIPQDKVISLGRPKTAKKVEGDLFLVEEGQPWDKLSYNAAGHRLERGILPNGRIVQRSSDLYKFNPTDYFAREWADKTKLNDFGLHIVDEATKNNVFMVRTPWHPIEEAHFYDAFYKQ